MDFEQKWKLVKDYYEKSYFNPHDSRVKIKFFQAPSEKQVDMLYERMIQLKNSMQDYYDKHSKLKKNLLEWRGKKNGIVPPKED